MVRASAPPRLYASSVSSNEIALISVPAPKPSTSPVTRAGGHAVSAITAPIRSDELATSPHRNASVTGGVSRLAPGGSFVPGRLVHATLTGIKAGLANAD